MKRLLFAGLSLLAWACQPDKPNEQAAHRSAADSTTTTAEPVNDFRIVPGRRVGPVRYSTSEAELLRLLGAGVVTAGDTVYGAEGAVFIGTTLYKDTADQLQILYQDSAQRKHPELVLIRPYVIDADGTPLPTLKLTRWSTADGLRIGATLTDLERRNGEPFRLWGFEWDYGGTVSSWLGGRLEAGGQSLLALTLGPPPTLTPTQHKALSNVLGDGEFLSSNPSMQLLDPVVQTMQVTLKP